MSTTIVALNILDGMNHRENWGLLQAAWEEEGMGFVEFCGWVEGLATKVDELYKNFVEHPSASGYGVWGYGVWEYEVCEPLGAQIVAFVRMSQKLPTEHEVMQWAKLLHETFTKE